MLSDHPAVPVLAVTDLARARDFYERTLGLSTVNESDGGVMYRAGGVDILVYPSSYAGTNKATAASFAVPAAAFDDEIADLRRRGVTFETYDMDGVTWDDGVATMGETRSVWFSDPDGNILNVESGDL
ncbi:MAG: hypothetical protein JWP95_2107 [Actinotalea sp.]|nr:hypothetical protein [Actinotalea sp.]